MLYGRSASKSQVGASAGVNVTTTVTPHGAFIDRIRKSLYYGGEALAEEMEVSRPLAEYASELFSAPHKGHSLNRLNTVAAGSVHATPCSLIMALIYLDRLNVTDPGYVRRITPQELFIVSMMISTKFYAGHDEEIYLSDWAEDGNMTENRLKQLELEFLCAIDWNIYISNEEFFTKLTQIERTLARREGLRRGWLTYTELIQLLPTFTLAKFVLNNITVLAVSYAASVMTIAGAFFLASQIPGSVLHRKATVTTIGGAGSDGAVDYNGNANDSAVLLCTNKTRIDTAGAAAAAGAVTVNVAPDATYNATCAALNVEAELLKLERQYREEAQREAARLRNHEIASATRLTLPDAVQHIASGNNKAKRSWSMTIGNDLEQNWSVLKEEYRDGFDVLLTLARKTRRLERMSEKLQKRPCFAEWMWKLSNGTTSIFWQLLGDTVQQSFVRLPLMWFKFM